MKNLTINNSNFFRNFALACSFLLISFNLSAQYAPIASATSFASNTESDPGTGLDLNYDFGWSRSAGVSFDNTTKNISFPENSSNNVTTVDFFITQGNKINFTMFMRSHGKQDQVLRVSLIDIKTNTHTLLETYDQNTTISLENTSTNVTIDIPNTIATGDYRISFDYSAKNNILDLSSFSTDATPSLLPVTYASLSARQVLESVQVEWVTSMEENSSHFEIERSLDGSNWEMIGSENSVGFSTEEVAYTFTDYSPASGTNIYRLKQVDFDGLYAYSNVMVVLINYTIAEETIQLFPNPSKGMVTIKGVDSPKVTVFNTAGTALYVSHNQSLLNLDFLQLGVYFLQIEGLDGKVTRHRFLKD